MRSRSLLLNLYMDSKVQKPCLMVPDCSEKYKPMNDLYFFVSDLHGNGDRYEKLFAQIERKQPRAVFFGGDLLPPGLVYRENSKSAPVDFVNGFLAPSLKRLKDKMDTDYPHVFLILGNDDPRSEEKSFLIHEEKGLWHYMHMKKFSLDGFSIFGYSMVPPTPFMLKDWERYDVSRYAGPGCIHPNEGFRTIPPDDDIEFSTIRADLDKLTAGENMDRAIFLFHAPPYGSMLDRAGLDGVKVDHVAVDVHVGSIAIKDFVDKHQPLLTLHGHVHESSKLTGSWKQKTKRTVSYSAAYEGPGLALVRFTGQCFMSAERIIL